MEMEAFFSLVLLLGGAALLLPLLVYYYTSRPRHPPLPPGPKGWPVVGNVPQLGPRLHRNLADIARTHGPLFRLRLGRLNVVVASDPATAALFLKTHDAKFTNRPPFYKFELMTYHFQGVVFAPYGPAWRKLRKLCITHLFSMKALESFQHVRSEEVSLLLRKLAEASPGSPIDLGEEVNACAMNNLGRLTVGRRIYAPGKQAAELKDMVRELATLVQTMGVVDGLPELKWLDPQGLIGRANRLHKRLDRFLDGLLAEATSVQVSTAHDQVSMLSILADLINDKDRADDDGERITLTDIKSVLSDLFAAGADTTSTTVEWALTELIRHPDVLRELRRELDEKVGRSRFVSDSDLPGLPYLQAVVKETFRLRPAAPLALPRYSTESCEVAGYHIPKNTTLLVNTWAITRDPKVWSDPLEFRPARFLPGGERPEADVRGNDFELMPFGAGRRICAGMNLGIRMVQLLVAALAHSFEWEVAGGGEVSVEEAEAFGLKRAVPLLVHPVKRLVPSAYYSGGEA